MNIGISAGPGFRARARLAALLAVLGACLADGPVAVAQHAGHGGTSEVTLAGVASKELLARPIGLRDGLGRLHQQVTTSSPQAQALYDQGIALLASYAWVDAARSFNEALRHDPRLAMAHVGLARALFRIDAVTEGRHALAKAVDLAKPCKAPERAGATARGEAFHEPAAVPAGSTGCPITEKERQWIAILPLQLEMAEAPADARPAKRQAFLGAIDALIELDPADAHAWVLRGNAEERNNWGIGQGGGPGPIAFYESALARDPEHLGAHHFLVHAWENLGRHAKAAEHGQRYSAAVPGVPHAQHMYAHVLPRLGRWEDARAQLVKADALERENYARDRIASEEDWHHGHNLHLLAMTELHLGHVARAEQLLREAYALDTRGALSGYYGAPLIEFLLQQGRADDALRSARELGARPAPMAQAMGSALEGQVLVIMRQQDAARVALARARKALPGLDAAMKLPGSYNPRWRVEPHVDTLAAMLELTGSDAAQGERSILAMADRIAGSPHLDAWAEGLVWLDRNARLARALGRATLADALVERIRRIDPGYRLAAPVTR
jgi:tetratricopeptide (TPR) repeat protein